MSLINIAEHLFSSGIKYPIVIRETKVGNYCMCIEDKESEKERQNVYIYYREKESMMILKQCVCCTTRAGR